CAGEGDIVVEFDYW
nr:immunoglobulin heavy chain junction region [Macaca mulatta]MOW76246.1 immunoglobulin heavy chain junction region [Macaca mulatta]MOW76556.1 immunoglobulin heavy chain junction region [Macaca mulatta]MOW77031.1 immunoglobulin heavy chain junction region [Macaca mulatta]MOW78477.1 immunoglobulin heavy chain junction region [Macaca mulatta]